MTRRLTDRFVAGVRCTGNASTIRDQHTRGLTLRVGTRSKIWYFVYRSRGPVQWLKLGEYPSLSLVDARARAADQRAVVSNGGDPVADQRKQEAAAAKPPPAAPAPFTFADFVPSFMTFQKGRKKTWADDQSVIDRFLLPAWRTVPLADIDRKAIHEVLDGAIGKGLTIGVNRLQATISRIFTLALDRGLVDAHPAARMIKRFTEQPRDRVLTDDELRALCTELDRHPGTAADITRLRLLLGQRGAETAGMFWREIDLETARWSLASTRTKNRRAHVVALPPTALALLKRRRTLVPENNPYVFPVQLDQTSNQYEPFSLTSDDHKALGAIHNGAYEWKDLRRTVATRLGELGFDETTIGRTLNHAKHTITAKHYNQHSYLEEIRQALTAWDVELQRILANEPRKRTRLLPMRRRA